MATLFQRGQDELDEIKKKESARSAVDETIKVEHEKLHKQGVEEAYKEQAKQILLDKEKTGTAEGEKEAYKEQQKQKLLQQQKLDQLTIQAGRILYTTSTVFPFEFFPTTLTISENKVDLVNTLFFKSRHVFNIFIADLQHVELTVNPFFGSLRFEVTGIDPNPEPVTYLKRNDAIKAKNIILGLIALRKEKVMLTNFNIEEIVAKAEEIGKTQQG